MKFKILIKFEMIILLTCRGLSKSHIIFPLSGTSKIERNCTVMLKVTEMEDGKFSVDACHSHYGHRRQLQHTLLTNRQRKAIALKVQQGIPSSRILDDIRSDIGNTLTKIHLMEKQDISNIAR